jgi:AcrR family transcriptional regulator
MDLQVQKLTAKGQATRQRIIEGAAAEIRERGVTVATLDDIRARTRPGSRAASESCWRPAT